MSNLGEGKVLLSCYGIESEIEEGGYVIVTAFSNLQPRDQNTLKSLGWEVLGERKFKYVIERKLGTGANPVIVDEYIEMSDEVVDYISDNINNNATILSNESVDRAVNPIKEDLDES